MRVFLIAFACEPNRTSEPGVGWHLAGEMALRHEVIVLTRENNRAIIEEYLCVHPNASQSRIKFLYFDMTSWWCRLKKRIPYGAQIYQETWNWAAAKRFALEMHKADIVHLVTFGAAFFTPYAARCSNRFVWGPIGGGDEPIPFSFSWRMGLKSVIMELMYGFATCYACKGNAWVNRFRHRSKAIIFRMADFASRMALCDGQIRTVVPETAYEEKVEEREFPGSAGPLRVMMLGRLLPHKGVLLALDAFAKYLNMGGDGNLIVCGTGSVKRDMEKRIRTLGIYNRVQMMGQCSHDRVLKLMDEYDVMLHLSFREGGAWSILECMAHGMPIICQGKSGMNDMVANDCGTKISASTPDDLIGQAADALLRYGTNPELLAEQGRKGQERVRKVYRWSKIADQIDEVYKKVVNC